MTAAFRAAIPTTQKFVLVALCDAANDQGECYPSVPNLMAKCSLSERAVQGAIGDLEQSGLLRREFRSGRSTVYWLTPAANAPRTECPPQHVPPASAAPTPARRAPPPPHHVPPTPAPRAPITVKEPSKEPSLNRKAAQAPPPVTVADLMAAGFDGETAAEFIAHKAAKKAPLTARAWADHQREAHKAGWTPLQAAEKVLAKHWAGFEAKYVAGDAPGRAAAGAETPFERRQRERAAEMTGGLVGRKDAPPRRTTEAEDVSFVEAG